MRRTAMMLWGLAGLGAQLTAAAPQGWVNAVYEENDLFFKTDRHYTQGIKVTVMPAEVERRDGEAGSFSYIPTVGYENEFARAGFAIGQNIYTPGDITIPTLITNDRPYAGWLYFSTLFHRRGNSARGAVLESLELDLGVVGPGSLAREAQTWVHEIRSFDLPEGWRHQLENEPGVRLKLLRAERWRFFDHEGGPNIDLIPHVGASLGTIENSVQAGSVVRAGWNLPDDFGIRTIDSLTAASGGYDRGWRHWFGFYGFLAVTGRAVAQNVFLDGSLFHDSHSIAREPIVGDASAGVVLVLRHLELGITYTIRSREFIGQNERHQFGSAFGKLKF